MMVPRKVIQGIALAFALGLTIVLVVAVWKGKTQKELQAVGTTERNDAEMRLKDMEYTELQEGKRLWTLRAAEAKYFHEEQKTLLSSVHVSFFLEGGEEVRLKSQEGALYAGSKNMEMWDSVEAVLPRGYQLFTERAFYDFQKKTISSNTIIKLTGPDVQLEGKLWEYRIPENKALVEGGVQGTLAFLPANAKPAQ
jgi:LPS export ABC transporter protein LptC